MRFFKWLVGAAAAMATGASASQPSLLILGTPHFADAGSHTIQTSVPLVLSPERQREIEAVVDALAKFRPTRIAVEWTPDNQARLDKRYADYRAGRHKLTANEVDQLALRLAARLGLPRVDAVDWSADPPGGWGPYNYETYIKEHGSTPAWDQWLAQKQQEAAAASRLKQCTPVSSWLRNVNAPANRAASHRGYYQVAQIGDRMKHNPGAIWVGNWYARNIGILNNIRAVATRPDDRVLVIFGSDHGYLLDQQARESGDFKVVDTLNYLPASPSDALAACP